MTAILGHHPTSCSALQALDGPESPTAAKRSLSYGEDLGSASTLFMTVTGVSNVPTDPYSGMAPTLQCRVSQTGGAARHVPIGSTSVEWFTTEPEFSDEGFTIGPTGCLLDASVQIEVCSVSAITTAVTATLGSVRLTGGALRDIARAHRASGAPREEQFLVLPLTAAAPVGPRCPERGPEQTGCDDASATNENAPPSPSSLMQVRVGLSFR